MTYPKKAKGFRNITVNEVSYRWRLRMEQKDSTVTLQGQESSGQQAIVTLRGVNDPWLAMPQTKTDKFIVTPATIRQLINEALRRGWKPNERMAPIKFEFVPNATA